MKKESPGKISETVAMDASAIECAVISLGDAIAASHKNDPMIALVGIQTGGMHLAERLVIVLQKRLGREIALGMLDINLYRDDLIGRATQPVLHKTDIPFDVTDRNIVLVDDVLFTGRTIRAAMDGVMDLGRPARVQLAVLVDRGHRELPIAANFVGSQLETTQTQRVHVRLTEEGHAADAVIVTS